MDTLQLLTETTAEMRRGFQWYFIWSIDFSELIPQSYCMGIPGKHEKMYINLAGLLSEVYLSSPNLIINILLIWWTDSPRTLNTGKDFPFAHVWK